MKMERNIPQKIRGALPGKSGGERLEDDSNTGSPALRQTDAATASSAERSLRVLQCVAKAGTSISLAEISDRLDLPKPTVHRLCNQLVALRFLARDVDERSFVVGADLRALAFDALTHGHVRGLRHLVLSQLVDEVQETCNFTTLDGAQVLYLDRVEAHWPLRLTLEVGSRVPLHCTASGKLFLAMLPARERDAVLATLALNGLTRNTLTNERALRQELDAIAHDGYATDREEFMAGLVAVAVPVRDKVGSVRAAIAMHAPTARMTLPDALARLPRLHAAAEAMRALL